jgi:hypothetical protein
MTLFRQLFSPLWTLWTRDSGVLPAIGVPIAGDRSSKRDRGVSKRDQGWSRLNALPAKAQPPSMTGISYLSTPDRNVVTTELGRSPFRSAWMSKNGTIASRRCRDRSSR